VASTATAAPPGTRQARGQQRQRADAIKQVQPHQPLNHGGVHPLAAAQRRLAGDKHHHGQDGQQVQVGQDRFKRHATGFRRGNEIGGQVFRPFYEADVTVGRASGAGLPRQNASSA
jgi:hypothetical protein